MSATFRDIIFSMRGPRGFALIYFLFVVAVILLLVSNLVLTTKQQLFTVTGSIQRVKALYAAESGLAYALAELEKNPDWTSGFEQEPLPLGGGTYTLAFSSDPASATAMESVNNLAGDEAANTYHGGGTLPPHSALLVVTGQVGGAQRTIEAVVVLGGDIPDRTALLGTGKITVAGGAAIDGQLSLIDTNSVPVDIHSNSQEPGALVDLQGVTSTGPSFLSGRATSSGESVAGVSILLPASGGVAGGAGSQLPPKKIPKPNITAMLNDNVGNPGPPLPAVPGPVTLNGANYYAGPVVIDGDLTLADNAKLYVRDDLTVRGSLKGTGALVVGGNTTLHGTADVTPGEGDYVSLISGGHVVLSGFRGQEYMENLVATDADAARDWEDLIYAYGKLNDLLEYSGSATEQQIAGYITDVTRNERIDALQSIVTNHPWAESNNLRAKNHRTETGAVENYSGRRSRTADRLRERYFDGAAPDSTEAFLREKLLNVGDLFRDVSFNRAGVRIVAPGDVAANPEAMLESFDEWDRVNQGGFFDAHSSYNSANSELRKRQLREAIAAASQLDYERLGAAEFKGVIYCEGALVVNNDINVLGAIVVNGEDGLDPLVIGDESYAPGDIALLGNTRLTYVEEMVQEGIKNLQGVGTVDVKSWVARP
jgi:hypothetical protein